MRRKDGFFAREGCTEGDVERMAQTVRSAEPVYVLYHCQFHIEVEEDSGDAYACVMPEVKCAEVHFTKDGSERIVHYPPWFIGPVEPGIDPSGSFIELTDEEESGWQESALNSCWCEPDPDRAFESRYGR